MATTQPSSSRRRIATSSTLFILLSVLPLLVHSSQAFLQTHVSPRLIAAPKFRRTFTCANPKCQIKPKSRRIIGLSNNSINESNAGSKKQLEHADIEWRLRPPEGTSRIDRLKLKVGANILRLDAKLRGQKMPPILCPRGGQAVLEAYYKESGKRKKKIARFGITTSRGPSCEQIDTTIRELYSINPRPLSATIAAIIYMFVEPGYRKLGVGSLALEVISAIHSVQAVDFTVLVADDTGSGGLVRWYETNGFLKAPLMQEVLGSPDGQFGIAMIRPVSIKEGFIDECKVKWW